MNYSKSLVVLSFILILSGCDGGGSGVISNKQPVANMGNNIDINEGSFAQFDASLSHDVDGSITSYEWKEGSTVLSTAKHFEKSDFSIGTHNITLNVTDNKGATASDQLTLIVRENKLVFLKDDKHGIEPWMTNGTASGTYLVKDINQKQASSDPTDFVWIGDTLFFSATDDKHGRELWVSDGMGAGTRLLKDIIPGARSSNPQRLTKVGNSLFFMARKKLWKTDGTEAGTLLIKDTNMNAFYNHLYEINGFVYFAVDDELYGRELWKSDGTKSGTTMVKDINMGKKNSVSFAYTANFVINDSLYFSAYTSSENQLWKSDGSENGTQMLKDIRLGSLTYGKKTNINNTHFFVALDNEHGYELWKTDGTTVGTQIVKDINKGTDNGVSNKSLEVVMLNNEAYFRANDGVHGFEIWKTDGTAAGTQMLKDVFAGSFDSGFGHYFGIIAHKNEVYFIARYGRDERHRVLMGLWKTDGTKQGTKLVKNLVYPERLFSAGDYIYFTDRDNKLWKSDGTENGTLIIKNGSLTVRNFNYNSMQHDEKIAEHNGVIYFSASDGIHGNELWKSDGTDAGTVMVKNIQTRTLNSVGQYTHIYKKGEYYYFAAKSELYHTGLWKTDGTEIGTSLVKDFNEGYSYDFNPSQLIQVGNDFYFSADDGVNGRELWKSDGTVSGTSLLKDIQAGHYGSYPENLIAKEGKVYFTISQNSREPLWITDGTEGGTVSVSDYHYYGKNVFTRISSDSYADGTPHTMRSDMRIFKGDIYYSHNNRNMGGRGKTELWKSNGTNGGTALVKEFTVNANIINLFELNNELYFTISDQLWKTDGTEAGTIKVKDIDNKELSFVSKIDPVIQLNNKLYFGADDGIKGHKFWVSDGTDSGTKVVADINISTTPTLTGLVTSGNLLYFSSYENGSPVLWRSDGTNAGTLKLKNSLEYINSSFEDGILFTVDDGSGTALWRTNGAKAGTEIIKTLY